MVFEFLLLYQKTPIIFLSLSLALVGFRPYFSNEMFFLRSFKFFELSYFMESPFFVTD